MYRVRGKEDCFRLLEQRTANQDKLLDDSGLYFRVPSVLADRFDIVTAEIWSNSSIEPKSSCRFRAFFLCNPKDLLPHLVGVAYSWKIGPFLEVY